MSEVTGNVTLQSESQFQRDNFSSTENGVTRLMRNPADNGSYDGRGHQQRRKSACILDENSIALVLVHRHNGAVPRTSARAPRPIVPSGLTASQRRRISAHINANLGKGIRIKDLATFLCLSDSHFCRLFRISFGISPYLYVTRRRVELAQSLMLTTSANLSEIALVCGMSDQSHLTRIFRRIVGDTPHAWRRSRLSGNWDVSEMRVGG